MHERIGIRPKTDESASYAAGGDKLSDAEQSQEVIPSNGQGYVVGSYTILIWSA